MADDVFQTQSDFKYTTWGELVRLPRLTRELKATFINENPIMTAVELRIEVPLEDEKFKSIGSAYYISNMGRVWNASRSEFVDPFVRQKKYFAVILDMNEWENDIIIRDVDILVAEAFVPFVDFEYNPKFVGKLEHINWNTFDNNYTNLRWFRLNIPSLAP